MYLCLKSFLRKIRALCLKRKASTLQSPILQYKIEQWKIMVDLVVCSTCTCTLDGIKHTY